MSYNKCFIAGIIKGEPYCRFDGTIMTPEACEVLYGYNGEFDILTDNTYIIKSINERGTTILLVEQNAKKALQLAKRAYVLETGEIIMSDDADKMLNDERVKKAYLGE